MEIQPTAAGWSEMSGGYPKRFAEFGSHTSKGTAVDVSGRKTEYDAYEKDADGNIIESTRHKEYNKPVLTAEEAAVPTLNAVMGQDDEWQPTLLTEQAPVPGNVAATAATITWDDSNYTLLWAVCKDGKVIAFTTTPSYTATEVGEYAVRAANEMGGLGEMSQAVTVNEITGISAIQNPQSIMQNEYYDLQGRRVTGLKKGVNIVKMSDGTVRKIAK
jgi:hypothetical protein